MVSLTLKKFAALTGLVLFCSSPLYASASDYKFEGTAVGRFKSVKGLAKADYTVINTDGAAGKFSVLRWGSKCNKNFDQCKNKVRFDGEGSDNLVAKFKAANGQPFKIGTVFFRNETTPKESSNTVIVSTTLDLSMALALIKTTEIPCSSAKCIPPNKRASSKATGVNVFNMSIPLEITNTANRSNISTSASAASDLSDIVSVSGARSAVVTFDNTSYKLTIVGFSPTASQLTFSAPEGADIGRMAELYATVTPIVK